MPLNGIDISSYQAGIDLYAVPADFVIVKATQGCGYENPDFERQAQTALAAGKMLGIYHYAATNYGGGDPVQEAEFFLSKFHKYKGDAVPVLDWESIQNANVDKMFSWCEPWCKTVESATGVKPIIYVQQSYMPYFEGCGYGLWIAQYATNDDVWGYQAHPWNEGAYECVIRQYTSCGFLDGWGGRLDLNKFYGERQDWIAMCGGSSGGSGDVVPDTLGEWSDEELADKVLAGEFGNGEDRKNALGARYEAVQSIVNARLSGSGAKIKAGTYSCAVSVLNVRTAPSLAGKCVAQYNAGETVVLDEWAAVADGYVWGRYTGWSGEKRYVAVREDGGEEYLVRV